MPGNGGDRACCSGGDVDRPSMGKGNDPAITGIALPAIIDLDVAEVNRNSKNTVRPGLDSPGVADRDVAVVGVSKDTVGALDRASAVDRDRTIGSSDANAVAESVCVGVASNGDTGADVDRGGAAVRQIEPDTIVYGTDRRAGTVQIDPDGAGGGSGDRVARHLDAAAAVVVGDDCAGLHVDCQVERVGVVHDAVGGRGAFARDEARDRIPRPTLIFSRGRRGQHQRAGGQREGQHAHRSHQPGATEQVRALACGRRPGGRRLGGERSGDHRFPPASCPAAGRREGCSRAPCGLAHSVAAGPVPTTGLGVNFSRVEIDV